MPILEIAAVIASLGYSVWKVYNIIASVTQNKSMTKWNIIVRIVNGAVTGVYEDFVRDAKKVNPDGDLTMPEKTIARNMAYDRVIEGLKAHNIGMKELKPDEILSMIEDAVTMKKNMAGMTK